MSRDRYDLSYTSYSQTMDEKSTQYANLIRRAERLNYEQKGKPTKEEANLYYEAAKVCEEIMSMNISQRAVYTQWNYRKMECENNFKRIANILAPPPPPAPVTPAEPSYSAGPKSPAKPAASKPEAKPAPTVTDSGIVINHASKDVPADMIEQWFKDVSDRDFSRVVGRTELKERLLNEAASIGWDETDKVLNISPVQCYFLYGPPGTGKTHLIKAFAGELQKRGFHFMQLVGSEVHAGFVGVAEKIVTAAFATATDNAPCLIFMDEIDLLCVNRAGKEVQGHEKRLTGAFLEAYNIFKESGKRIIFMGATNHPGGVDNAMLDRITLIKVPLPAEEDRIAYFQRVTKNLTVEAGLTPEDMASVTDNYSYRDLDRMRDSMLIKLKTQAIKEYRVLDENGNEDRQASDQRVSEALAKGEICLTRALFEQTRKENPPSDKSAIRQELQEFEERAAGLQ